MELESRDCRIMFRLPGLQSPMRTLVFRNPSPDLCLMDLKSLILREIAVSYDSLFFTLDGRLLSDSTPFFRNGEVPFLSTITGHLRFFGGGGDGGATGAESRDCYLKMYAVKKPDKADPNELRLSKWVNCSLSNEPLRHPVVVDKLGNLFNKEALVQGLLSKNLPKVYGYIKGLKDMIPVELADIPGVRDHTAVKFQCPVTGQEFNGKYKFFALKSCGHVLSAKGLKEVKSSACLVCHKEFTEVDKLVINGTEDEVKALWDSLSEEKTRKDQGKKSKKVIVANGIKTGQLTENGKKHRIDGDGGKSDGNGSSKKFKAVDVIPANATKAVYESIFTSSKKSDFKETYSCRSLPLGRN